MHVHYQSESLNTFSHSMFFLYIYYFSTWEINTVDNLTMKYGIIRIYVGKKNVKTKQICVKYYRFLKSVSHTHIWLHVLKIVFSLFFRPIVFSYTPVVLQVCKTVLLFNNLDSSVATFWFDDHFARCWYNLNHFL